MNDHDEIVKKTAEILETIPPMPASVIELRRAIADPNVNYNRLLPAIEMDPTLCAEILRHVNSALFAVGHQVTTVSEAVRYFGVVKLVDFVAATYSEKLVRKAFRRIQGLDQYFSHAAKVSIGSAILANFFSSTRHDHDVYAVTGLLHDIGRLVILLLAAPNAVSNVAMSKTWELTRQMANRQEELLHISHSSLGAMILEKWNFPEIIRLGVDRHHIPVLQGHICMEGLIVFLADVMSADDLPDIALMKALPSNIMAEIGLTEADLARAKNLYQEAKRARGLK